MIVIVSGVGMDKLLPVKEVSESSNMASRLVPERLLLMKFTFPSVGAHIVDPLADPEKRKVKLNMQAHIVPRRLVLLIK